MRLQVRTLPCMLLLLALPCSAARGELVWFPQAANSSFVASRETPVGEFLAVGWRRDPDGDGWVVLLDASGEVLRSDVLGGPGPQSIASAARTQDGGLVAVGGAEGGPWVVRLRADGSVLWQVRISSAASGGALRAAAELLDGTLLCVGEQDGAGWLVGLDSDGAAGWERFVGPGEDTRFLAAASSPQGGALVVGQRARRGLAVRIDADGALLWQILRSAEPYRGPPRERAEVRSVAAHADGSFSFGLSRESCFDLGYRLHRTYVEQVGGDGATTWRTYTVQSAVPVHRVDALSVGSSGNLLGLLDFERPYLWRLDADGRMLRSRRHELFAPVGLAVDSADRVLLAGSRAGRAALLRLDDFDETGGVDCLTSVPFSESSNSGAAGGSAGAITPVGSSPPTVTPSSVPSLPDCIGPDCASGCLDLAEDCSNDLDDDSDAHAECRDVDCLLDPSCAGEDFDRDGRVNDDDCAPDNSRLMQVPIEVHGFRVTATGTDEIALSWDNQGAESG